MQTEAKEEGVSAEETERRVAEVRGRMMADRVEQKKIEKHFHEQVQMKVRILEWEESRERCGVSNEQGAMRCEQ